MCLPGVGGAWEAVEVGRIEKVFYRATLLTCLHRGDKTTVPV